MKKRRRRGPSRDRDQQLWLFQVKEVVLAPKVKGKIDVTSRLSVYQADWIGANFLATLADKKDRSWKGSINLYDVKQWIGANGKASPDINDGKDWIKYWGNVEADSYKMTRSAVHRRRIASGGQLSRMPMQPAGLGNWIFPPRGRAGFPALPRRHQFVSGRSRPALRPSIARRSAISNWLRGRIDMTAGN